MNSIQCEGEILQPSKVVCVGQNYVAHIEELNSAMPDQPVIFIKPNSAISDQIQLQGGDEVHYEGEISFIIKDSQISAVGFGLDLTKRTVQSKLKNKGLPWERSKAFDGSAIFSEFRAFDGNNDDLTLELHLNGELKQQGGCQLMLFKPDVFLASIKSFLTLEDGDVIMTGTPAGVGQITSGDEFVGKIFDKDKLLIEKKWLVK